MAYTTTSGKTFTRTDAEKIAAKIAADLFQMKYFYGSPSEDKIKNYTTELIAYLADGYLDSIDYGFRKGDKWVVALSYKVSEHTGGLQDDNAGRVPTGANISGASWGSYLRSNNKFDKLSGEDLQKFLKDLPFQRDGATDPLSDWGLSSDKAYSSGDVKVSRRIINNTDL